MARLDAGYGIGQSARMFDLSFVELATLGGIALVVLGPEKLPQAVRTVGTYYAKFRRTVGTLKAEMEAELDLVETRQLMEKELAKIKQAEAQMQKEMAQLRGNMREFEQQQDQSLKKATSSNSSAESDINQKTNNSMAVNADTSAPHHIVDEDSINHAYAYNEDAATAQTPSTDVNSIRKDEQDNLNDAPHLNPAAVIESTRPWQGMWFLLGDYDRALRLPAAPFLPNYEIAPLLNATQDSSAANQVVSNANTPDALPTAAVSLSRPNAQLPITNISRDVVLPNKQETP